MLAAKQSKIDSVAYLNARPGSPIETGCAGRHHIRIRPKREALLCVPESALAQPAALAIMLHGAGGNAEHGLRLLDAYADRAKLILLAPESRKASWDIIADAQYGPDVSFIDECLRYIFSRYAIDETRVALGGFSDGASYALSLGLSNGFLFRHILAFSPGFMAPVRIQGEPRIFLSHGTRDDVLPIDRCSRRLLPLLQSHRLTVEYREFDGPHTIPDELRKEALDLLIGQKIDWNIF